MLSPEITSHRLRPRTSIAFRLPLAAAALVVLVATALVTAAFLTMKSTSIRLANERLEALAKYFSDSYATATTTMLGQVRQQANNDSLVALVQSPTPENRDRAVAFLASHATGRAGQYAVQVRDLQGKLLASTGTRSARIDSSAASDSFPHIMGRDSMAAGALQLIGDTIVYPLVAVVGSSEPRGYLVVWRPQNTVNRLGGLMGNLLGSAGAMYLTNADGSLGTDFSSVVTSPKDAPKPLKGFMRYTRPAPRGQVLAAVEPIAGTPWVWAAEFPMRAVVAPSVLFLKRLSIVALICVAFALMVAWSMSRRLTAPLLELSAAADAIAAGERGLRIQMRRGDELGRLGISFDAMAAQVDESHHRLEEKVSQRTEALNRALEQLQDAQEALLRREKLAMLGQLASSVGHELRNPLGVMSNAIYYLQLVQPDAPREVKEYLGILQQQVAVSGKIVTDLLDFARATPVQRVPVPLHSIVEAQRAHVPELDLEEFEVEQEIPESLPLAGVDVIHAGQVVLNLLTNAVQAMGSNGGRLSLRATHDGNGYLRLAVSDSGPGVSRENIDKVFEPLFTTKARGIGLGLSVSRSLAQANGGDLLLESTPGCGATFVFLIPTAESIA